MKKTGKIVIYIFLIVFVLLGSALSYVKFGLPDVGTAPELKIERTAARIERGKYLANHVSVCLDCHSKRDWSKFAGPALPKTFGAGGELFDESAGLPGAVYSPNITPHNLKSWTDGELFRVITTGVTKEGTALMNIMPYQSYGKMDKEDIYSIIAYLRTLPSVNTTIPERRLDFPLNFLVNTIPQKAENTKIPAESDTIKYGAYIVNAAGCVDCHTKQENGKSITGMEFAGGREFPSPVGNIYSANITTDELTGIGKWTKQQFIERFRLYGENYVPATLNKGDAQTIMPWIMYAGLKESDLTAMYMYLKTVKPIKNQVVRYVQKEKLSANVTSK